MIVSVVGCQQLLRSGYEHSGWLRTRSKLHTLSPNITSMLLNCKGFEDWYIDIYVILKIHLEISISVERIFVRKAGYS